MPMCSNQVLTPLCPIKYFFYFFHKWTTNEEKVNGGKPNYSVARSKHRSSYAHIFHKSWNIDSNLWDDFFLENVNQCP